MPPDHLAAGTILIHDIHIAVRLRSLVREKTKNLPRLVQASRHKEMADEEAAFGKTVTIGLQVADLVLHLQQPCPHPLRVIGGLRIPTA